MSEGEIAMPSVSASISLTVDPSFRIGAKPGFAYLIVVEGRVVTRRAWFGGGEVPLVFTSFDAAFAHLVSRPQTGERAHILVFLNRDQALGYTRTKTLPVPVASFGVTLRRS